jgi:hypothetical protein
MDEQLERFPVAMNPSFVMPGLVPGIHVLLAARKTWMAGTSPAMTADRVVHAKWKTL